MTHNGAVTALQLANGFMEAEASLMKHKLGIMEHNDERHFFSGAAIVRPIIVPTLRLAYKLGTSRIVKVNC